MTAPARRPSWRRKRYAAALALWLIGCYLLGYGPWIYAGVRGWRVAEWTAPAYRPLNDFLNRLPPKNRTAGELLGWHNRFWLDLAHRHAASD